MNRWVYNGSMAAGVAGAGIGAGLQFGLGAGLMIGGLLVIGLTIFGARLARGDRG